MAIRKFTKTPTDEFRGHVERAIEERRLAFGLEVAEVSLLAAQLAAELQQPVAYTETGVVLKAIGVPRRTFYSAGVRPGAMYTAGAAVLHNRAYWMGAKASLVREYIRNADRHLELAKLL